MRPTRRLGDIAASPSAAAPSAFAPATPAPRRATVLAIASVLAPLLASTLAACGGGSATSANSATSATLQGGAPIASSDASASATASADTTAIADTSTASSTGDNTADLAATVQTATRAQAAVRTVQGAPAPIVAQANPDGAALTVSASGFIDTANPFFAPMGNGRSCASCHAEGNGWSITPAGLRLRFTQSAGADPVFRLVDGANSPNAAAGTLDQKRAAYSMLLTKGVIRVGLAMPANAEFTLLRADDPYGFASAKELSLFRRPLPSANLKLLSTVMWDARETRTVVAGSTTTAGANCVRNANPALCYASVDSSLLTQASDAVRGHAEAAQELSAAAQRSIVDFESGLFTAQQTSSVAGSLLEGGAAGGPLALSNTVFYFGINDLDAGDYRTLAPFTRNVMTMFGAWRNLGAPAPAPRPAPGQRPQPPAAPSAQNLARASIARGEALFNTRPFNITRVAGFNDVQRGANVRGSCASCHSAPNAGSHSVPLLADIGVADGRLRTPDMPLYMLRNSSTGETMETTDPGQAMLTGRWRDVGKMKVPVLRGLAARAPYFHNGAQADLAGVVRFYDRRFQIGFTPQEVADLTAFLKAL